jgi:adenine nucleotide transporter 17
LDGFRKIIKYEGSTTSLIVGVSGLYKGIEAKLLQSVLTSAFLFASKEELFNWAMWVMKRFE